MKSQPIFVNGDKTAELDHGATTEQFYTLWDAVAAFQKLPEDRKEIARIITDSQSYSADEIVRFNYGNTSN